MASKLVLAVVAFLALAKASVINVDNLPNPSDLALQLGEDEFEDYLDYWLSLKEGQSLNTSSTRTGGCSIRVNGDLGQPQPVYFSGNTYWSGDSNSGIINLASGEEIDIHCTGSNRFISHANSIASNLASATIRCSKDNLITGSWLNGESDFFGLVCTSNAFHDAIVTTRTCAKTGFITEVGFIVNNVHHPLYESCFDPARLEVLYVKYEQNPENAVHQSGVTRPSWLAGPNFPGVGVNTQYTQVTQKATIASIVGQELADKYVTATQFLARGHLSAKTDFVFATGQRATFYFCNAAPQWQPFNAGNWNFLEQNLRARIGVAQYQTTVYTGTWGVSQLRDQNNVLRDIYLYTDANNNLQLPVPLYYYKVVHDRLSNRGVAFVSINNPYYTMEEILRDLVFCTDRCRENDNYSWAGWRPDQIDIGYSFCCEIDDFRRTVDHLPSFTTSGLLF